MSKVCSILIFIGTVFITNPVYSQDDSVLDDPSSCYSDHTKMGDCWKNEEGIHTDIIVENIVVEPGGIEYGLQMYVDKNHNLDFTRQDRGEKDGGCGVDAHLTTEWLDSYQPDDIYQEHPIRNFTIYKNGSRLATVNANRCGAVNVMLLESELYMVSALYSYNGNKLTGVSRTMQIGTGSTVNIPVSLKLYLPIMAKHSVLFHEMVD